MDNYPDDIHMYDDVYGSPYYQEDDSDIDSYVDNAYESYMDK